MVAAVIDGKALAASLRETVCRDAEGFAAAHGRPPGLSVIMVGDNPASDIYVRNKVTACEKTAIRSFEYRLPAATPQAEIAALIARLNEDAAVDGILLQLPLPEGLDANALIFGIDPAKDVDGLHPINAGRLLMGVPGLVPCTPQGCVLLAKSARSDLSGLHAVVIGRSHLVGKPVAQLLLAENCTVTQAHSRTRDLPELCRAADILVAAIGKPAFVKGDWIKPGAIVIDVGINRLDNGTLCGDVAYAEASEVAGAITPVPGGVGPMTIACLLANTVKAARGRKS